MKTLIILDNPPPHGERGCNGLRMTHGLQKTDAQANVTVFLMAVPARHGKIGHEEGTNARRHRGATPNPPPQEPFSALGLHTGRAP
jgi:hypothetical protein